MEVDFFWWGAKIYFCLPPFTDTIGMCLLREWFKIVHYNYYSRYYISNNIIVHNMFRMFKYTQKTYRIMWDCTTGLKTLGTLKLNPLSQKKCSNWSNGLIEFPNIEFSEQLHGLCRPMYSTTLIGMLKILIICCSASRMYNIVVTFFHLIVIVLKIIHFLKKKI